MVLIQTNMHRGTVYGHAEWKRHQSPWRHMRHISKIFSSGVIAALAPPVLLSTLMAVFVSLMNFGVSRHRFANWVPLAEIAIEPFQLLSSVLALLLVFRTNASYQRFDEARKAWGSNVNRCRDLARQCLMWITAPDDQPKRNLILRHLKAYPYLLKIHLTLGCTLADQLDGILSRDEIDAIYRAPHKPIFVLQIISEVISSCRIADLERVTLDTNLTQFHDNVGTCERIFKTPIPVAYTRLTSRVLMFWHLALPYGLWETCGWLTIPATFMSAAALFYIEQVGVVIEEPFWILALESICSGITSAIDGLSNAHDDALLMVWGLAMKKVKRDGTLPNIEHIVVLNHDHNKPSHGLSHVDHTNIVVQRSPTTKPSVPKPKFLLSSSESAFMSESHVY